MSSASAGDKRPLSPSKPPVSPDSNKIKSVHWTSDIDGLLLKTVLDEQQNQNEGEEEDWDRIASRIEGKSAVQCLKRYMVLKATAAEAKRTAPAAVEEDSDSSSGEEADPKRLKRDDSYASISQESETTGSSKNERASSKWSVKEMELLRKLVEEYKGATPSWIEIAKHFDDHNAIDCLDIWQSLTDPPATRGKGSWTAEEDQILIEKRALYGRKWAKIAAHLPGRLGKQCRERFVNNLDPDLKKGVEWTDDEEAFLIAEKHNGTRWKNITDQLPGRSDNDVKNQWFSTIQRKFQQYGKDRLIQAAIHQVQIMKSQGALPSEQPLESQQRPDGPYSQATRLNQQQPPPNPYLGYYPQPPPPPGPPPPTGHVVHPSLSGQQSYHGGPGEAGGSVPPAYTVYPYPQYPSQHAHQHGVPGYFHHLHNPPPTQWPVDPYHQISPTAVYPQPPVSYQQGSDPCHQQEGLTSSHHPSHQPYSYDQ